MEQIDDRTYYISAKEIMDKFGIKGEPIEFWTPSKRKDRCLKIKIRNETKK